MTSTFLLNHHELLEDSLAVKKFKDAFFPMYTARTPEKSLYVRPAGTPIYKLSAEILLYIFRYCVAFEDPLWPDQKSSRAGTSPLALSLVCQFWRTTAVDNPSLWCSFDITLGRGLPVEPKMEQLHLYLSRSKHVAISFRLDMCPIFKSLYSEGYLLNDYPTFWTVYDVLRQHQHRWRAISLPVAQKSNTPSQIVLSSFITLSTSRIIPREDALRRDVLQAANHNQLKFFSQVPELWWCSVYSNPMTKLEYTIVDWKRIKTVTNLARRLPNLQTLVASLECSGRFEPSPFKFNPQFEHDNLRCLSLTYNCTGITDGTGVWAWTPRLDNVEAFRLPSLRAFRLVHQNCDVRSHFKCKAFDSISIDVLVRSFQTVPLQFLCLGDIAVSEESIWTLLDVLPNLTHLIITGIQPSDKTLKLLSSGIMVSKLQILEWVQYGNKKSKTKLNYPSLDAIRLFLHSRMHGSDSLLLRVKLSSLAKYGSKKLTQCQDPSCKVRERFVQVAPFKCESSRSLHKEDRRPKGFEKCTFV